MGGKTSRLSVKEDSSKWQNLYEINDADPRPQRYYSNEPYVRHRQQGGHNYEQQGFGQSYQVASSHDQPQGKHLKSKKKSEKKKKKDKKARTSKKSKHAPVSERSDSKKHKPKVDLEKVLKEMKSSEDVIRSFTVCAYNSCTYLQYQKRVLENNANKGKMKTSINEDLEDTRKKSDEKIRKYEEDLERKTEEIKRLESDKNDLLNRQDLENTRRVFNEKIRRYEEDLERKTEKIKHLEAEKNDLLNRQSSEAAARMTYNNPNITYLSDQDRPTKISERYTELYDNQWTDAFQNLQKSHQLSDTKAIEVLLDVLYICFDVCKMIREQRDALVRNLTEYVGEAGGDVIISEVMTTLKGAKKKNIKKMHKDYAKKVQEVLETKYSRVLQCIGPYVNECVELCLLMNIQDPPLELRGIVSGENPVFDVAVFRPYTKSGNRIKHMVWPALYLYNNGPLLCRGIAQGMRDSPEGIH